MNKNEFIILTSITRPVCNICFRAKKREGTVKNQNKKTILIFTVPSPYRIKNSMVEKYLIHFLPASASPFDWYAEALPLFQIGVSPDNPGKPA